MTCGPSGLPFHSMFSICTLEIYLCILDGLELHWVQGDSIVTLARLFLFFLFTSYSNWPNTWPMKIGPKHGPKKWLKYKPKIKPIVLWVMFVKLDKNERADNINFPWDESLLRSFLFFQFSWPNVSRFDDFHHLRHELAKRTATLEMRNGENENQIWKIK